MANEIQVTASLTFAKGAILAKQLALNGLNINVTGVNYEMLSQSIPTTAGGTAIKLGGLTNVGWLLLVNRDTTNYVDILTAVSGTAFARLFAGEPALLRLNPALAAPAMLANTLAVLVEGLLVEI